MSSHRVYEHYPILGALLGLAVWLFLQLPAAMPLDLGPWSPLFVTLAGVCAGVGSTLAFGLGLVGLWRPGGANVVLSLLAMIVTCMPAC